MQKQIKKMDRFFRQHPGWNATAHFMGGIGIGFILCRPSGGIHPIRWGMAFIIIGISIHLKAMFDRA